MTTLMLIGMLSDPDEAPPSVIAIRFCDGFAGVGAALKRAKARAKKQYPDLPHAQIEWDVYEVKTSGWGFPFYLGPAQSFVY